MKTLFGNSILMQVSTILLRLSPLVPTEKCELGDVLYALVNAGAVKRKVD